MRDLQPLVLTILLLLVASGCSDTAVPASEPAPGERLNAEIYLVEVSTDGLTLDLYVDVCEQEADLSEFDEVESEVRARVTRTPGDDLADCATVFTRQLTDPLAGRPIVDLSTGEPVQRVSDLSNDGT